MGDEQKKRRSLHESKMPYRPRKSDFDGKIAGLYDLEETIGEGHFAVVKLAKHVFTGEKVAVKVIDKTKLDEVSKSHLFQEVRCMKLVQHPNVVRLYEVIDTQTKLYLILELGDGGDMYDYIMKHEKGLDEKKARHYFRQIVEAISYCHKLHVVHRDLKPENVVFFQKVEMVKLTDFGFSNMFNPGRKLETSCGSLAYSAPEILLGDSYDAPAVDIWSLGVILYMLVCGEAPFQEANDSETLTMIMDCKYNVPPHISDSCKQLISSMLKREPSQRAHLGEIEDHAWLKEDSETVPHHHMPLISRELLSEDDHMHVIDKMVEGCIAPKEDIIQSVEKDMYNHITATYYLLAERRLKKHRQEQLNAAAMSHVRKNSAPSGPGGKPHLEPLALSPRKQREIKKTKTAPVTQSVSQMLAIPESPSQEYSGELEPRTDYFKSLTFSQTLGRSKQRTRSVGNVNVAPSSAGTQSTRPKYGHLDLSPSPNREIPTIQEPVLPATAKKGKKPSSFSKIAILSNFFEQKIAALSGNGRGSHGRWRLPGLGKKKTRVKQRGLPEFTNFQTPANSCEHVACDCILSKEAESADDRKHAPKQKGLMMSLLSPQGIHPAPSTSRGSPVHGKGRKCSLIKEESLEEGAEGDDDDDMDVESYLENIRLSKSADNLDTEDLDMSHNASSPMKDAGDQQMMLKRPLLSVASSPQLLNQICEENESDEEDDFVPMKLNSTRMLTQRNSVASPEVIRKYEARKKRRGTGSRGTSCSSSDASDTDDTEGRSRKNKLKHKFAHRRDSSDHSSDTDGGPSGPGGGGGFGKGLGGGGGGGGGNNGPGNDGDDKGGGGGKKDKGGSPKNGRHHHRGKQNNLSFKIGGELITPRSLKNRTSDISVSSGVSNLSLASLTSKSSLKYVLERDENVSDSDAEDNGENERDSNSENNVSKESHVEMLNQRNNLRKKDSDSKAFSSILGKKFIIDKRDNNLSISSQDCDCSVGKKPHKPMKTDINSNMFCNKPACQGPAMKVETKCCSLV